jgi:hypothetical protein
VGKDHKSLIEWDVEKACILKKKGEIAKLEPCDGLI